MLEIAETRDLAEAAQITFNNMIPYYEKYGVDWDEKDVYQATEGLLNFDVLKNGQVVGVLRLSFEEERCQLRDIQIGEEHQNKGYGKEVISLVKEIARQRGHSIIELKVFQCSPAFELYKRVGFEVERKDDRFYYMNLTIEPHLVP